MTYYYNYIEDVRNCPKTAGGLWSLPELMDSVTILDEDELNELPLRERDNYLPIRRWRTCPWDTPHYPESRREAFEMLCFEDNQDTMKEWGD